MTILQYPKATWLNWRQALKDLGFFGDVFDVQGRELFVSLRLGKEDEAVMEFRCLINQAASHR